eukprot:7044428-Prymnesium_polylepis.1
MPTGPAHASGNSQTVPVPPRTRRDATREPPGVRVAWPSRGVAWARGSSVSLGPGPARPRRVREETTGPRLTLTAVPLCFSPRHHRWHSIVLSHIPWE